MSKEKNVFVNRQAFYNYHVMERYEAGLSLMGTEIKSIRDGKADLRGSYAKAQGDELWLFGTHVGSYDAGGINNHDPKRPRKLLLHKAEIKDITDKLSQKGLTLVPLRLYVKKHWAKVELGLAKGKRKYDKRRAIIERERDREAQRAVRHSV